VLPEAPELTLRLLLSHRSGVANYMDGDEIARDRERDPFRRADAALGERVPASAHDLIQRLMSGAP